MQRYIERAFPLLFSFVLCTVLFILWTAGPGIWLKAYIHDSTRRWFRSGAQSRPMCAEPQCVDEELHKQSRWTEFNATQFQRFVAHQIQPLQLKRDASFRFLEAGVGVGAFARVILRAYPNATGVGFDLEPEAIAIAKTMLPRDRMRVFVGDMRSFALPENETALFDHVFVPGALCYLHSLDEIHTALERLTRALRPGGGLCASMLASMRSNMGSCNTRIPKAMWLSHKRVGGMLQGPLTLLSMQDMDTWHLPHALGRYAVCIRKVK
jgi:SAM-dependent methyltransferase